MCLFVNVVFISDSEAFSRLVKLWIVSSLARLLLVIWALVGDVSILVSAYFVYQNNGRANTYNKHAWRGVRNLHSWQFEKQRVALFLFGFPKKQGKITSKDKVMCKICRTKLTYHVTTSNMRAHLLLKTSLPAYWHWLIHCPLVDRTYTT